MQVKSVFVDGMPPTWDEEKVKEHFEKFGEIERIVLARNMLSAKRKDFGFVNYLERDAAMACIEAINNTEISDGDIKVHNFVHYHEVDWSFCFTVDLQSLPKCCTSLTTGSVLDR